MSSLRLASPIAAILALACIAGAALAETPKRAVEPAPPPTATALMPGQLTLLPTPANCNTGPADTTTNLGPDGIEQFSPTPNPPKIPAPGYGHPPTCTAYVADFMVDKSSAVASSYYSPDLVLDAWDSVRETSLENSLGQYVYYVWNVQTAQSITEEQCRTYQHEITVFRKRAGETAFSILGGGSLTPTWQPKGLPGFPVKLCMLNPSRTFKMIPRIVPPASGVDTYRVAIQVGGAPGQLIAAALHPPKGS
jgi:hypothetical protein